MPVTIHMTALRPHLNEYLVYSKILHTETGETIPGTEELHTPAPLTEPIEAREIADKECGRRASRFTPDMTVVAEVWAFSPHPQTQSIYGIRHQGSARAMAPEEREAVRSFLEGTD